MLLHFALQYLPQARPRRQRRGHQHVVQLRHGRRVQHRIMFVLPQKPEQRRHPRVNLRAIGQQTLRNQEEITDVERQKRSKCIEKRKKKQEKEEE